MTIRQQIISENLKFYFKTIQHYHWTLYLHITYVSNPVDRNFTKLLTVISIVCLYSKLYIFQIWYHFTNLSEDDQVQYLSAQKKQVKRMPLQQITEEKSDDENGGKCQDVCVVIIAFV